MVVVGIVWYCRPNLDNRQLLSVLRQTGANLDCSYPIKHHFIANSLEKATQVCETLAPLGLETLPITQIDETNRYSVTVITDMVLTLSTINRITNQFQNTARRLGVEYDGWSCELIHPSEEP